MGNVIPCKMDSTRYRTCKEMRNDVWNVDVSLKINLHIGDFEGLIDKGKFVFVAFDS